MIGLDKGEQIGENAAGCLASGSVVSLSVDVLEQDS